jgi:VWFA-related protein
VLAWALGAPAAAQAPEPPPRFTAGTSAVVLDVVVRDRAGRPVTGLARGDFEVFEDRRRQTISVFAGPGAGRASAPASSAIAPPAVPRPVDAGLPRVVALAFEQLGPASRALAAQAARRLVDALGPGDFAAVFTIDRAVQPVLGYTPPSPAVGTAIDAAASRAGLPLRRAGLVPGAEFQSVEAGQPTPETRDEAKRTRGFATLDALSQIVQGLSLLPGRKMVVLFSEGLALDASEEVAQMPRADGPQPLDDTWLTDGRFTRFQRLVEQANAAQVAFYTFDAAGLRTDGPFSAAGFGRAPYVGLLALAEGTGGAFVESTNDLAPGARRAAADQASYYVLGYSPSKAADGTYRQLRVRARCDGCTVLARRGYRATPAGPLRQVGVRDVAALLALEAGTVAADLDVTLETMPGPSPGPRTLSVRATLPESAVTPGGVVTFLARVTDGGGRAVALVSQHFERRGSSGPGARLTFERTVPVPAGGARLELCVYDHATRRATVLRRGYDPSQ